MLHREALIETRWKPSATWQLATLSFLINWLYTFSSGIVCLILIFRRNFPGYIIEFIMVLLFLSLFLCFLIHIFTSWIVCTKTSKIYKILFEIYLCQLIQFQYELHEYPGLPLLWILLPWSLFLTERICTRIYLTPDSLPVKLQR